MLVKKRVGEFFKKRGKKQIIFVVYGLVFLLVAACIINLLGKRSGMQSIAANDTEVLAYTDFSNSIGAAGTVESAESTFVYSSLANPVEEVYVQVGDYVEEGELLAKLDDQKIIEQIESQETSMRTASAGSTQTIKTARDNYDQFKYTLEKGLNSGINSAESQVAGAYENYTRAIKTYERYRDGLDAGENSILLDTKYAYDNAKKMVNDAAENLRKAEEALADLKLGDPEAEAGSGEGTEAQNPYEEALSKVDKAKRALEDAENSRDHLRTQYRAAVTSVNQTLADYAEAVESAEQAYRDALANLETAQRAADNQLQAYRNSLESAKIGADDSSSQVTLRQLKVTLSSTKVTAPVSGTVTAVYATAGLAGSGLLFVIENITDLVIETSVKEYDIGTVAVGMPVTIKSNATGNDIYEGIITDIAPTSNKTSLGTTDTSGEVEFATKVKIISPDTRLRIGMNVRLNYITEQQDHVLCVPHDSIYTNQAGEHCILILEEQPDGGYLIKELPITTELENDLVITISGSGVSAGLRVINEPGVYQPMIGKRIKLVG